MEEERLTSRDMLSYAATMFKWFVGRTPFSVRHAERSMVLSVDDEQSRPSSSLISLAMTAIQNARSVSLASLDARLDSKRAEVQEPVSWHVDSWPGEHYRLLAGLIRALAPGTVIEIGTGTGLSALAMATFLPVGSELHTFDVANWEEMRPYTCLKKADFEDGRLVFHQADLSDSSTFAAYSSLLKRAGMMFIDGPKDGRTEPNLLRSFQQLSFDADPLILVFDDTRIWNMLGVWRSILAPKLDLTSFGHWLGTGLVEWRRSR